MKVTIQFNYISDSFEVRDGVKKGCVLTTTLFEIYFAVLLNFTFKDVNSDLFIRI